MLNLSQINFFVFKINHKLFRPGAVWTDYLVERMDTIHNSTLFHVQLMYFLQKIFNFSVRIRTTNTWSGSESTLPKNVTGELGFLVRRQAMFMLSPYRVTPGRLPYGDFTVATWTPSFVFLLRHPKEMSIRSKYLAPFQWPVWAVAIGLVLTYVIITTVKVQQYAELEDNPDNSLPGVLTRLFGYTVQQYAFHLPKLNSTRILIVSHLLMGYLLYQYYCTFIIASLIMETPKTIKTLDHLINSGLQIGTTSAVYSTDLFLSVSVAV